MTFTERRVIDLTKSKDIPRVLRNAVIGVDGTDAASKGTWIAYHEGETFSLPKALIWEKQPEAVRNKCIPVQRKLGPDLYRWFAVVR